MDKITLSNIVVHAVIGVHRFEQSSAQPLSIDFSFSVDAVRAAKTDSISDTHDYSKIYSEIISFVKANPCRLLETLAKRLSDHLKKQFHFAWMQLSITKHPVDMPDVGGVKIVIENRPST